MHLALFLKSVFLYIYLEWPLDPVLVFRGSMQRIVLELNIQCKGLEATIASGVEQTASYAATCGADEVHLLIFDRDGEKKWDDRIWERGKQWMEELFICGVCEETL
jgi:hypothetical protein